jgi:hypothetical protein
VHCCCHRLCQWPVQQQLGEVEHDVLLQGRLLCFSGSCVRQLLCQLQHCREQHWVCGWLRPCTESCLMFSCIAAC